MFVGDEVRLDVSFAVAREKLTRLGPALSWMSGDAATRSERVVPDLEAEARV
jgi:hypothetical protein